jgi:phenylalanyl-tRNA synthetase beta chain
LGWKSKASRTPPPQLGAFRICRVIEAVQHPNADRLRVCRVETFPDGPGGRTEEVQVVCGAPNAKTGLVGVFAPPGTHVPGTGVDLKPGNIRGVDSNGMLCSERELMLSDNHDGIIELPADAPLGVRYIDYRGLNDPVIEIKVTPNRPDALGIHGIARDLAARGMGKLKPVTATPSRASSPRPSASTSPPASKPKAAPISPAA